MYLNQGLNIKFIGYTFYMDDEQLVGEAYDRRLTPDVETEHGRYFLVFERHVSDVRESDLPTDFDVMLIEEASGIASKLPGEMIQHLVETRNILDEVLEQDSYFGISDIAVPNEPMTLEKYVSLATLGTAAGAALLTEYVLKNESSRRNFLIFGGTVAVGAGIYGWKTELAQIVLGVTASKDPHGDHPATQAARSLHEGITNGQENNLHIFFRNIVNAVKHDSVAQVLCLEKEADEKAIVVSVFGHGHSGIVEDLRKDSDELRVFISEFYEKDMLQEIVDLNGGLEAFCSSYVARKNDVGEIEVDRITDQTLFSLLDRKGIE